MMVPPCVLDRATTPFPGPSRRVGGFDHRRTGQGLAAPVAQLGDPRVISLQVVGHPRSQPDAGRRRRDEPLPLALSRTSSPRRMESASIWKLHALPASGRCGRRQPSAGRGRRSSHARCRASIGTTNTDTAFQVTMLGFTRMEIDDRTQTDGQGPEGTRSERDRSTRGGPGHRSGCTGARDLERVGHETGRTFVARRPRPRRGCSTPPTIASWPNGCSTVGSG